MLIYIFFLLIFTGLANAVYLLYQHAQHKKNNTPFVCPLGGHCDEVLNSKYNKTLGVQNEYLGIGYILGLGAVGFVALVPSMYSDLARITLLTMSSGGILFSVYLLYVMKFVLKQYCTWCLLAHAINFAAFIVILKMLV